MMISDKPQENPKLNQDSCSNAPQIEANHVRPGTPNESRSQPGLN